MSTDYLSRKQLSGTASGALMPPSSDGITGRSLSLYIYIYISFLRLSFLDDYDDEQ